MQKILSVFILTAFSGLLFGQTNYEKFQALFKQNDTVKIKNLLSEWEQSNSNDPEFYTSAFNFYFSQSKQETILIGPQQGKKESLQLTDSTGKVAAYLSADLSYNPDKLITAFIYINKGIEKFPSRLDMRFGKCYAFEQMTDYGNFTKEVIKTVEYSVTVNNNWLWTENKKVDDSEAFMLRAIQDYLKQLYDTEDDLLLENMKQIGEVTIQHYPNNVEILSTTAVANMLTKNYDKAIEYLKHAEKINPKDFIVLNNIAQGYKMKGDKINAIKYFELAEKYGDARAKEDARQNIRELKQ